MKTILLIGGKAGSGKDTIATLLHKKLNNANTNAYIVHNADKVKQISREVFGWDSLKNDLGRQLLVNVTKTGYDYDKYFWEKYTYQFIKTTILKSMKDEFIIIPDWRYPSTKEYFDMISQIEYKDLQVKTILVERNTVDDVASNSKDTVIRESEDTIPNKPKDYFDYIIDNTTYIDTGSYIPTSVFKRLLGDDLYKFLKLNDSESKVF